LSLFRIICKSVKKAESMYTGNNNPILIIIDIIKKIVNTLTDILN